LPPLALDIFSIITVYIGVISVILSDKTERESFEERLRAYIVPHHFASLPVAKTLFAHAIQDLVDYYVKQHAGGYLPIYENMRITITIEVLNEDQLSQEFCIPKAPYGYSWLWFHFTIKSSWTIKPMVWGPKVPQQIDPQDYFVGEVIVMSYQTFLDLYSWTSPKRIFFFPIPIPVFAEEPLRPLLASVRYLSLKFQVTKWSETAGQMTDPVELQILPLLTQPQWKKAVIKRVIKRTFPGIEQRRALLQQACDGVYEIYKIREIRLPSQVYIYWPHEQDRFWSCHGEYHLILPAKVIKGEEILWDQQSFQLIFERVATVNQIVFCKEKDSPLTFGWNRPPELLCYPYLTDPAGV
jgi:hypothetical protein